jgi:hypothetical protein
MKILLHNPDNGVTRNFMPRLWMFLLKALTPPEPVVLLIDGNAQALDEDGLARFVREHRPLRQADSRCSEDRATVGDLLSLHEPDAG